MIDFVKLLAFCMGLCAWGPDAADAAEKVADRLRAHAAANTGGAGRLCTLAANVAEEIAYSHRFTGLGLVPHKDTGAFPAKSGPNSYPGTMEAESSDRRSLGRKLARLIFNLHAQGAHVFGDGQITEASPVERRGSPLDRIAEQVRAVSDDLAMHKHNAGENNARIFEALDLQEVDGNHDRLFSGVIATVSAKVDDTRRAIGDVQNAIGFESPEDDGEPARSLRLERVEQRVSSLEPA